MAPPEGVARMRDETITGFLEQLAARQPAPGGGAVAALHAAHAAALLGMVARYSNGPRHAQHETVICRVLAKADALREQAVGLAAATVDAVTDQAEQVTAAIRKEIAG